MLKLAFITVARSDFSRLLPVLKLAQELEGIECHLIVGGNHTLQSFGSSITEVESHGLCVNCLIPGVEEDSVRSAEILKSCSEYLANNEIDYLVILGDRFEMLAAAQAAVLSRTSIIHIGGGYQTEGAFDDDIRHAITQLSEIHMVATEFCFQKVERMLGNNRGIYLTGAPDLEILSDVEEMSREAFCKELSLDAEEDFMLVTLHPETRLSLDENKENILEFEKFLATTEKSILMTAPCADPGSAEIFNMIERLQEKPGFIYRENLGGYFYVNALRQASLLVGNSSSGIIEAGSFAVPVINVGARQRGREQNSNVINCPFKSDLLEGALSKAQSEKFRQFLSKKNIYGDGHFSKQFFEICNKLLKR